jgi:hypothetical protein
MDLPPALRKPRPYKRTREEVESVVAAFELSQVVELAEDFPNKGLTRGTLAAVVAVFDQPFEPEAYEIEVVDERGDALAEFTVSPAQIRPHKASDARSRAS